MRRAAATLLLVAACAPLPVRAPVSQPREWPRTLRPSFAGAQQYDDVHTAARPSGVLAERAAGAVADAAAVAGLRVVRDSRLDAVAADLARFAGASEPPPYAAVAFLLAHAGVIEPSPHLMVVTAAESDAAGAAGVVRERTETLLAGAKVARIGVGSSSSAGLVTIVVALQESLVELSPVPRSIACGGEARLRGRLLAPLAQPEVFVTRGDGQVERPLLVVTSDGGFDGEVRCGGEAERLQVEVVGDGRRGAEVAANFPLWCGGPPPTELALEPPTRGPTTDAEAIERRLFELLNRDRRAAGHKALAWDERARDAARLHSAEMRDKGFVGHVSTTSGSPADRLKRAGVATPLVLENLARAYSAEEADEGLMDSPGHRANALNAAATHVGIGVALGRAEDGPVELYATELFLRVLPRLERAAVMARAAGAIRRRREAAQVGVLKADRDLDGVAQAYADLLAAGGSAEIAAARANAELDRLGGRFRSVTTLVVVVADPEDIAANPALVQRGAQAFGLGVAQGRDARMGDNAVFAVAILGLKR